MTFFEGAGNGEQKPFDPQVIAHENEEALRPLVDQAMSVAMGENLPTPPLPGVVASNLPPISEDSALVKGGAPIPTVTPSMETAQSRVAPTGSAASPAPSIRRP